MARKVILDMDPGIDDALAIVLALRSPELKVEAITTVAGNVEVEKTSKNALKILEAIDRRDIPVAKGSCKPLVRALSTAPYVHGKDGLGNSNLPEPNIHLLNRHAVDLIVDEITNSRKGEITIVATGPLTNVAMALMKKPRIAERIAKIITMSGTFGVTEYGIGNVTPVAEYNVYADPEAAEIVYKSRVAVVAVGLDVTMNPSTFITPEKYEEIKSVRTKSAQLAARIMEFPMEAMGVVPLHDPMAVAAAVDPSLVATEKHSVWVEMGGEYARGQTIIEKRRYVCKEESWEGREGSKIEICKSVEGKRFLDLFMKRVIHGE